MDNWPNGKLTKWEIVKMASWLNGELTKWRVGQMLSWPKGLEPNLLPLTFLPAGTGPSTGRTPTRRSSSCCRRRCRSLWWSDEPRTSSSGSWSGCYVWTRCGRPSAKVVKCICKWWCGQLSSSVCSLQWNNEFYILLIRTNRRQLLKGKQNKNLKKETKGNSNDIIFCNYKIVKVFSYCKNNI